MVQKVEDDRYLILIQEADPQGRKGESRKWKGLSGDVEQRLENRRSWEEAGVIGTCWKREGSNLVTDQEKWSQVP